MTTMSKKHPVLALRLSLAAWGCFLGWLLALALLKAGFTPWQFYLVMIVLTLQSELYEDRKLKEDRWAVNVVSVFMALIWPINFLWRIGFLVRWLEKVDVQKASE